MRRTLILASWLLLCSGIWVAAQNLSLPNPASLPPSGACGGDLGGTFPNCNVTGGSHITNGSIANSGLSNSAITIGGASTALGGTYAPARTTSFPANKSITASSSTVMMGFAGSITPVTSGNAFITIHSYIIPSTANDCLYLIRYGTGTAPINGAAATGTIASQPGVASLLVGNDLTLPAYITGMTLSTAYWLDLSAQATTTSITCQALNNAVIALEQ